MLVLARKCCTRGSRELAEKEGGQEVEEDGVGEGNRRMFPLGIKSAPLWRDGEAD